MKKFLLSLVVLAFAASTFAAGFTVRVSVADALEGPYVWAWDAVNNYSNGTTVGNGWPGTQIAGEPDVDGYWSFTFPAEVDNTTSFIIFNNGASTQTVNIPVAENWVVVLNADFTIASQGPDGVSLTTVAAAASGVTVVGNVVKVASASSVEIVSISGLTVQSSAVAGEFVSQPLSAGLYVVVVDGKASKVLVK